MKFENNLENIPFGKAGYCWTVVVSQGKTSFGKVPAQWQYWPLLDSVGQFRHMGRADLRIRRLGVRIPPSALV